MTRSVSCLLFTPVGRLVSHHSVLFRLLVHHIKLLVLPFLYLFIGVHHIQEYPEKKRGRKQKYINPQEEKARREQQMKTISVTVQAKLVVGYWYLVPIESVSDNSSEQDTATVTKDLEEPAANKMRTLWWKDDNCSTLNKSLERQRNPAVNGVCDEDPISRMTVNNCLQRIGSRPITFDNAFPLVNQVFLSQNQVKYVEDIIFTRDMENLGVLRQEVIHTISDIGQ